MHVFKQEQIMLDINFLNLFMLRETTIIKLHIKYDEQNKLYNNK